MTESGERTAIPLVATYRLQLHKDFTLRDAAAVVPYLAQLGVSHLYLSPIFTATPGSTHGYDVIDHRTVNPELGGMAALTELASVTRSNGMGIIIDIVPNHVGLGGGRNPWWRDVLRHGARSEYAAYFDIDWDSQPHLRSGQVVYPLLGEPFGVALNKGQLQLEVEEGTGELVVRYFEHTIPLDPRGYRDVVGVITPAAGDDQEAMLAVTEALDVLDRLATAEAQDCPALLERWHRTLAHPVVSAHVAERLQNLNGTPGVPQTFDELERILQAQNYRLAFWRIAGDEINYRRFFDINELAAIRQEHAPVFEDTHRLVAGLLQAGIISGVRVDHIDGLFDPKSYLEQLSGLGRDVPGFTLHVEKIVLDEELPPEWPCDGTTGYDFLARCGLLLTDPAAEQPMTATYEEFIGNNDPYEDVEAASRRQVLDHSFTGEVAGLAIALYRIAQRDRESRDHTLHALRDAIEAMLSTFPVYRTYLADGHPRPGDEELIQRAAECALRQSPGVSPDALDFLCRVLSLHGELDPADQAARLAFRARFQQLSGPAMAKGVEDTTFFRYVRLLCLNEVGSEPRHFSASPDALHSWFHERAEKWPKALNATTTHDTKRSEDARYRLHVLPEFAQEWRAEVRSWSRTMSRYCRHRIEPNHEYYFYQSAVAAWPGRTDRTFTERMKEHMQKALREAKDRTSWTRPDERYEEWMADFIDTAIGHNRGRLSDRIGRFVARIDPASKVKALAGLTLKLLAPGVPDIYQGAELPDFSLTDPDNRRPVDYALRMAALDATDNAISWPGTAGLMSPDAKIGLVRKLLELRRTPGFEQATYTPLALEGEFATRAFGFVRETPAARMAIVVPISASRFVTPTGVFAEGSWRNTRVVLPTGPWTDCLTGTMLESNSVPLEQLFHCAPVAVLRSGVA